MRRAAVAGDVAPEAVISSKTMPPPLLLAIMGPTASGKTGLAEAIATRIGAQLVSADAFQVYRGMDVGTAKPKDVQRYELLDIKDPNEHFGVGEWTSRALDVVGRCFQENRHAVVVGGTGLYIRAFFEEYAAMQGLPSPELRESLNATPIEELRQRLQRDHPETAQRVDMANPVRVRRALERLQSSPGEPIRLPPFRKLKLSLMPPPDLLNLRIEQRALEMVHNGWTREIEVLRLRGFRRDDPGLRAIGYRTLWDCVERKISLDEATAATIVETRQYAKRQRTWLRSEPDLVTLSGNSEDDAVRKAMDCINDALV